MKQEPKFEIYKSMTANNEIVYKGLTKKEFDIVFKNALMSIEEVGRMTLINTFLKEYKHWWTDIYSKSTYYRLLNVAIDEFNVAFDSLLWNHY